jgi:hypothetical protein
MTDTGWLDQFSAGDLSPVEKALAASAIDDVRDQAAAGREDAARQVAAEERTEALVLANRVGGDPLGNLQRARAAEEAADDECRGLAAQLVKAEARRDRARGNAEFWAQRTAEVTGQAQRSAPSGVEGALSRAQEALREETSRRKVDAMLAQRSASRPVSPPKAHGPGGCEVCARGRALDRERRESAGRNVAYNDHPAVASLAAAYAAEDCVR